MKKGLVISFILTAIGVVLAGGFQISVEPGPDINSALIVKTFGCYTPSDAELTGTAEGIIRGERKTVGLNFKHSKKGIFTVAKQWPDEGVWVITIKAQYRGLISNAIVEVDSRSNAVLGKGKVNNDGIKIKLVRRDISREEVNKLLSKLNKDIAGV